MICAFSANSYDLLLSFRAESRNLLLLKNKERCLDSARHDEQIRMKFSVNWLAEFVDLPKNAKAIADLLTRAGIETENIEMRGAKIDKVIVSQVTASSRHPNADRLTVCEVDDGSGTKRQIVF